jgi:tight adherence protein C
MLIDLVPILLPAVSFAAVAVVVFVAGHYLSAHAQTQRRLAATTQPSDVPAGATFQNLHAFVARHFVSKRFGIEGVIRDKLRRELLRAGYFRSYAVNYYLLARLATVVVLPISAYAIVQLLLGETSAILKIVLVSIAALIAIAAPDAYLARRRRRLSLRYRQIFPDLLDLLVICIDAGLSFEAAFDRVRGEIFKQSRELGTNLEMMGAEMRAGRSILQALEAFADRLGFDEATSFNTMLRQSIELGSDIGEALRIFGEEMRDKRLLRAEEAANKLSVKIILPLGLFIFPVVLLVVMLPVVIKLLMVLR